MRGDWGLSSDCISKLGQSRLCLVALRCRQHLGYIAFLLMV